MLSVWPRASPPGAAESSWRDGEPSLLRGPGGPRLRPDVHLSGCGESRRFGARYRAYAPIESSSGNTRDMPRIRHGAQK